ncbi:hypothetical protein D3C79_1029470 [compost metagenome]
MTRATIVSPSLVSMFLLTPSAGKKSMEPLPSGACCNAMHTGFSAGGWEAYRKIYMPGSSSVTRELIFRPSRVCEGVDMA